MAPWSTQRWYIINYEVEKAAVQFWISLSYWSRKRSEIKLMFDAPLVMTLTYERNIQKGSDDILCLFICLMSCPFICLFEEYSYLYSYGDVTIESKELQSLSRCSAPKAPLYPATPSVLSIFGISIEGPTQFSQLIFNWRIYI